MTSANRVVFCATWLLAACSVHAEGHEPTDTHEPVVQLSLGTQTGGSGDQPYCDAPLVWTEIDEQVPYTGVYVGAVQLQGWLIDCEVACKNARCGRRCASNCYDSPAPTGNVRMARLEVTTDGSLQRVGNTDQTGQNGCANERRIQVRWALELEDTFAAQGSDRMSYITDALGGYVPTSELELQDLDPSFDMATPEDFQALGREGTGGEDSRGVYVDGYFTLGDGEALVELSWRCDECSNRLGIELARGVLQLEGASPKRPDEPSSTYEPQWQWPEAVCQTEPSGGAGGESGTNSNPGAGAGGASEP